MIARITTHSGWIGAVGWQSAGSHALYDAIRPVPMPTEQVLLRFIKRRGAREYGFLNGTHRTGRAAERTRQDMLPRSELAGREPRIYRNHRANAVCVWV